MSGFLSILLAVFSGVLNGSYAAPMKLTKKWEWENIWLLFSFPALVLFPSLFAMITVPDLLNVYRDMPSGVLWQTFLFGAGWGLGSVSFGLALYMVGLSLGYTIMMGIIAVAGSLVPMLVHDASGLLTARGGVILSAILIAIGGVILCGTAGMIREQAAQDASTGKKSSRFLVGLLVCLFAGVFSAMLNLAFDFGAPIAEAAQASLSQGNSSFRANNAIWCLALLGGFGPNCLYCVYLLVHKGTWKNFRISGTGGYWLWACFMGLIFTGSIMLYGLSASNLGKLGTTVGWLIFVIVAILMANLWGVITKEWKGVPQKAHNRMLEGSLLLISSVVLMSIGNHF